MSDTVHILLATCNGERFLTEQLDSIAAQSHSNWLLHVADDGSTDNTLTLLEAFSNDHPKKVQLVEFPSPVGSAKANFLRLLARIPRDSAYIAFCDQDDVWVPHKIERLLAECKAVEAGRGDLPCLVYSDLTVTVAGVAAETCRSFQQLIRTDPTRLTFAQLLLENSIPGCSALFNNALLLLVRRYSGPLDAIQMHDWWIALIALGCGRIAHLPEPLARYRLHGKNVAGVAPRGGIKFIVRKAMQISRSHYPETLKQAQLLEAVYGRDMSANNASIVGAYCRFERLGKLARVRQCIHHGILKQTMTRRIHQMLGI